MSYVMILAGVLICILGIMMILPSWFLIRWWVYEILLTMIGFSMLCAGCIMMMISDYDAKGSLHWGDGKERPGQHFPLYEPFDHFISQNGLMIDIHPGGRIDNCSISFTENFELIISGCRPNDNVFFVDPSKLDQLQVNKMLKEMDDMNQK